MMEYRSVIVLQDARAVRDNLVQELAQHDFAVRSCGSVAGFRHLYAVHPSPLVVLTGDPDHLARNAHDARVAAPAAVIIALGTGTSTAWRLHVMAAGADACHAASIDIVELVAILSSWRRHAGAAGPDGLAGGPASGTEGLAIPAVRQHDPRRQGGRARAGRASAARQRSAAMGGATGAAIGVVSQADAAQMDAPHPGAKADAGEGGRRGGADAGAHVNAHVDAHVGAHVNAHAGPPLRASRLGSGWRLDMNCRVLVCPRDRALLLTLAESNFLMRLAASDGQLLHRRIPGVATHPTERDDAVLHTRGMDVVVSRLRRKARQAGIQLPLLAVRGCGYLFAEWLTVSPSFSKSSLVVRPPAPRLLAARPSRVFPASSGPMFHAESGDMRHDGVTQAQSVATRASSRGVDPAPSGEAAPDEAEEQAVVAALCPLCP